MTGRVARSVTFEAEIGTIGSGSRRWAPDGDRSVSLAHNVT